MMILSDSVLGLIQALVVAFAAAGKAVVPAGRRQEVVRALTGGCIGPVAMDEYLALLSDAFGQVGGTPPEVSLVEFPIEAALRDGLAVLTDEQLVRLALSADAIRALSDRVTLAMAAGELGEGWWEAAAPIAGPVPESYLGPEVIARNRERLRRLISGGDEK